MQEKSPSSENPCNVSQAFAAMSPDEFTHHLRSLRKEKSLHLVADWTDVMSARRVKAFVEYGGPAVQNRTAGIRATKAQKNLEPNVFSSGVDWIEK
mgnify:FL=1